MNRGTNYKKRFPVICAEKRRIFLSHHLKLILIKIKDLGLRNWAEKTALAWKW